MKNRFKDFFWLAIVAFGMFSVYAIPAISGCSCHGISPIPSWPIKQEVVAPQTEISVIAFVAPWCEPCNRAKLSLFAIRTAGVYVMIIDVDKTPDIAMAHGITSVPTFFVYVKGKKTTRTQDISVVVRIVKENT